MTSPRGSSTVSAVENEIARGASLSVSNLVDYLIEKAHLSRASDIHIDPTPQDVRVRLRIDGVLQEAYSFPKINHQEIVSRIKVLARLRTDEHQSAQDGRFRQIITHSEDKIDIRVSIVPTYHGENVVLRLLSDREEYFSLDSLGFSVSDQEKIKHALTRNGMILVTGPTGSGKTTTLYTLIKMLSNPSVSIVTIEDPIEYAMGGIRQIQVNGRTGLTFANGLRSMLRQDPDIIMVGEIRDAETAGIAINTALTGHLLLSTIHTSDAGTTLPRLLDMGIAPYLVASTINIAIAQRLVRKICTRCKERVTADPYITEQYADIIKKYNFGELYLYRGRGCGYCQKSGYAGRISINEVLVADDTIREVIVRNASSREITKLAIAGGMTPMFEDGMQKVFLGQTSFEEIIRVIHG
jgi:type IV pilus assembly protein PilB